MGKRKIEMRRIEKKSARQVCFSKRRQGLFKKAKELSTLCGVDITILVFSPAGRFYSFANTDIESILARYCKENNCKSPTSTTSTTTTTSNGEGGDNFWREKVNVKEMEKESDLQQQLQNSLQEVRGKVVSRIEEPISSASSLSSLVTLPSSLDLTTSAAAAAADVTWLPPLDHLLPPRSVGDESAANAMNTTNVELEAPPLPLPHDGDCVRQVEEESLFLDFALDEDDDGLLMPVFGEEYDDGLLMKPEFEDDGLISRPMDDDMFVPLDDYGTLFGSFEY
ncbi:agamous-like MADS-box protein AGL29 [Cinnamomum micranthum f. kanehirae]|uniref:Agamous-like MADS-box protein AGL29 n=1 Tax=Cinnamomum micranthum f. kanehirae TaxID=337451 RepID=A0A3S3NVH2_9MAGN|nr:agamous-like MADS-box protein AGL29 [Cinnamomum micranthum f. kanehirae]